MQTNLKLQTADDFAEYYDRIYNEGRNIDQINEDMYDWFSKWVGFEYTVNDLTEGILTGEFVYEDIKANIQGIPKENKPPLPKDTWVTQHYVCACEELSMTFLKFANAMHNLYLVSQEKGLGATLEMVAGYENHYLGLLDAYMEQDQEYYVRVAERNPGLNEYAGQFFFSAVTTSVAENKVLSQKEKQIDQIEEADEQANFVINEIFAPLTDNVLEVMKILIAFYNHLQKEGVYDVRV